MICADVNQLLATKVGGFAVPGGVFSIEVSCQQGGLSARKKGSDIWGKNWDGGVLVSRNNPNWALGGVDFDCYCLEVHKVW